MVHIIINIDIIYIKCIVHMHYINRNIFTYIIMYKLYMNIYKYKYILYVISVYIIYI